jgi:salicylate hydroxylase
MNIIVVGAGIGGLSAAIALGRKGHRVRVIEHNQGLSEFGAGIQIAPNAVRLLYAWNLREEFEKLVFMPRASVARRYASGDILGQTPQNPDSVINYGFP